jgi:presenilin 1
MGFAMFNVFFFLTGALILQLLRLSGVHMDLVSFCFLLFNFSVRPAAGCSSMYAWPR